MKIIKKTLPKGKYADSGDIIIVNDSYLLIGWDYHEQKAITIDLAETTNNIRIYNSLEEIRKKYEENDVIQSQKIEMHFK